KSCYPVLKDYKDDWVVSDFLRVYLKNSSTRMNQLTENVIGEWQTKSWPPFHLDSFHNFYSQAFHFELKP
ncbi:hypothetical protein BDR06DRAFT_896600, partial [Suillus hirtellus]